MKSGKVPELSKFYQKCSGHRLKKFYIQPVPVSAIKGETQKLRIRVPSFQKEA